MIVDYYLLSHNIKKGLNFMKKKQALELSIELWEKLADSETASHSTKRLIYKEICLREFGKEHKSTSTCFLCDKYFYYKSLCGFNNGCHKCPLYKAGYGCDTEGTTNPFRNWYSIVEEKFPDLKKECANRMVHTLKQLRKKSK